MKILKLLIISALCLFGINTNAQKCEMLIVPYVQDEISPLPEESRSYLTTKLEQIITQNGIGASEGLGQFYLVSKFAVLNKDIVSSAPRMISQKMAVSISLVDYFGEKVIAATTFEIQGVGQNENKMYINALRNINPENAKIQEFVKIAKEKILSYYDDNYQTIIKKAQTLASMKNYEEALFYSSSIPECSKGYEAAVTASKQIYKQSIDYFCSKGLFAARNAWAASPNAAGAAEVAVYLNQIDPDATCYKDALTLYNEIKTSVKEDWKYEFRNYDERALEIKRIDAIQEIGVAWGKGQQPKTTNIIGLR
jgi:hypothetical protein